MSMISDQVQNEFASQIHQEALLFVDHFRERSENNLDFTVESLKITEDILHEVNDFIDEFQDGQKNWIISKAGSYIFEVARINFGGSYYWHEEMSQPILVTGQPDFEISILAFEKVKQRIENGKESNIPFYFQGYMERVLAARKGDKEMII